MDTKKFIITFVGGLTVGTAITAVIVKNGKRFVNAVRELKPFNKMNRELKNNPLWKLTKVQHKKERS